MEKISGEDLVEMTNAVNELIDRLKTLEDKVKFIMKHSCFVADVKIDDKTLQDLYDEQVSSKIEHTTEPTVKECDCEKRGDFCSCPITELYNDGEISLRKRTIISGKPTVKCMCGEQTTFGEADVEIGGVRHRVKHPCYVIPTDNSEKDNRYFAEIPPDAFMTEEQRAYIEARDEKIEEIISTLIQAGYKEKMTSWLRDKLRGL